jgi:putative Mg2+ transporter-C (MgtC) family protein
MGPDSILMMFLKLMLAVVLGGLIGIERETHGRPAGLRTHILVCLGSALFTIVSTYYTGEHSDPSRIASQIVSGIGFLGAGTIIRQGSVIRGLTTAASLWTTAAIGMAAGAGGKLIYIGVIAAVIVYVTLSMINRIERRLLDGRRHRELHVSLSNGRTGTAAVIGKLTELGVQVEGVRTEAGPRAGVEARMRVVLPQGTDVAMASQALAGTDGVESFDWE